MIGGYPVVVRLSCSCSPRGFLLPVNKKYGGALCQSS